MVDVALLLCAGMVGICRRRLLILLGYKWGTLGTTSVLRYVADIPFSYIFHLPAQRDHLITMSSRACDRCWALVVHSTPSFGEDLVLMRYTCRRRNAIPRAHAPVVAAWGSPASLSVLCGQRDARGNQYPPGRIGLSASRP